MIEYDRITRRDVEVPPPEDYNVPGQQLEISLATLARMDAAIRNISEQDPSIIPTQTTGEQS